MKSDGVADGWMQLACLDGLGSMGDGDGGCHNDRWRHADGGDGGGARVVATTRCIVAYTVYTPLSDRHGYVLS